MIELREHQERAVEELRANVRAGIQNQMLCAPTSFGKTEVALYLLQEARARRKRAAFVVDRTALVNQTSGRMDKYEIPHGVLQSGHWRMRPWELAQVASVQTIARRKWPEDLALIVVDEAHGIFKAVADRIVRRDTVVIGLSATPFTKGLGKLYDAVVSPVTTKWLIENKWLAPFKVFNASSPDMAGAKVVAGEWTDDVAAERSMPIVGDCVAEYLKHGAGRKALAFGCNVAHCEELQRQFMAAGVQAALYTYHVPDDERARLVEDFKPADSVVRVLISVAALARGFDQPDVSMLIIARPLRSSLSEHVQMLGRGLRRDPSDPEKTCIVLDHAGNFERFWEPMNEFFERGVRTLDDGKHREAKPQPKKEKQPRRCPRCFHLHNPKPYCPECGYSYPRQQVRHEAGDLMEFGAGGAEGEARRYAFWAEARWVARERNYAEGFATHLYKDRFGAWPPRGLPPEPVPASPETLNYVRHRLIAHARGRGKRKRSAA